MTTAPASASAFADARRTNPSSDPRPAPQYAPAKPAPARPAADGACRALKVSAAFADCGPRAHKRSGFLRSESGAGTIEFVVLFPVLVLIILFIAWASAVISRASNIQEVAHDLARSALRYSAVTTPATLCSTLERDELTAAIKRSGETLPVSRFTFGCTAQANAPYLGITRVEISLSYNAAGDAIGDLGRSFGWNIARIERRSVMIY